MEKADIVKATSHWTAADLENISLGIMAMELCEIDPWLIELYKRRYQELAGTPWTPGYHSALFEAGKRQH